MTLFMIAILAVCASAGLVGGLVFKKKALQKKRKTLLASDFPQDWIFFIDKNMPLYSCFPESLKKQLHGLVNVFLDEKKFVGCGGQEITDEIKVTIAAQACMLLLNRKTNFYPKLKTIYVYPHTYVAKGLMNDGGLIVEGKSVRLGESWQNGPVVLTWDSITGGARNIQDGRNVVFHEFAHQLDQE
ncbi:MAG: zinc-dependent peptidase, partial [Planctomycetota bacterium]